MIRKSLNGTCSQNYEGMVHKGKQNCILMIKEVCIPLIQKYNLKNLYSLGTRIEFQKKFYILLVKQCILLIKKRMYLTDDALI